MSKTTGTHQHDPQAEAARLFAEGVERYEAGGLVEAGRCFDGVLTLDPTHAGARLLSAVSAGSLAIQSERLDEAAGHYRRALALQPDNPPINFALGTILRLLGQGDEAAVCYRKAIDLNPDYVEAHIGLGDIHLARNDFNEALGCYARAVDVAPDNVQALCNLGYVFSKLEEYGLAAKWLRAALEIDPGNEAINWSMISVLEYESRLAEARIYRDRVPRPKPLVVETAPTPRRAVLILSTAGTGMVPYYSLIPPEINTRINWYVDCATDGQEDSLPAYDLVFNAIGNAEVMAASAPRMTRFLGRCRRPVLNPPERVALTRRDLMPRLLAGIPNVVVPSVARLRREEIGPDLAARLAAGGISCPLLVRPVSGQGGRGVVLVETPEQLAGFAVGDADAYYFIAFHDYKSPDGYYRKYRTIFVDRRAYHYHLAISPRWLVHYFSAEMQGEAWKREEERRYLENPALALGPAALAAVEAIGRAMDMDYAGIDYSVQSDGRVLVFEANATMSVVASEPEPELHVRAIFAAFEDMLARRGAGAPGFR